MSETAVQRVEAERAENARPKKRAPTWPWEFARDVAYLRAGISNLFFIGPPDAGDRNWVLVDAGLCGYADCIAEAAASRFGSRARPAAILLTHGHFDHVGALADLAKRWDAPIHAHPLEMPFLTGRCPYPPPDPTVGGGLMSSLSWLYPRGPIDLGGRARDLPADGVVPELPGWRWIHTPGHSPGHVSFFRDRDRTLIAGDAFVTTNQESALSVLTQRPTVHRPPAYFTQDWEQARHSVETLAALKPVIAGTGHGVPVKGEELHHGLLTLAVDFQRQATPPYGRYVGTPAEFGRLGVISTPPDVPHPLLRLLVGFGLGLVAGQALRSSRGRGA